MNAFSKAFKTFIEKPIIPFHRPLTAYSSAKIQTSIDKTFGKMLVLAAEFSIRRLVTEDEFRDEAKLEIHKNTLGKILNDSMYHELRQELLEIYPKISSYALKQGDVDLIDKFEKIIKLTEYN